MSFTQSPYIHMGVITRDGGFSFGWECDSCGAECDHFDGSTTVAQIRNDFSNHILTSHARTEADFDGWS